MSKLDIKWKVGAYMTNSVSSVTDKKYNIVAFFSGVGGIELGFEQTGEFRVVYANEFDKNARKTYALNYPDTFLDSRDIHAVDPDEIPSETVDLIVGGFLAKLFLLQVIVKALKMSVVTCFLNCFE